MKTYRVWIEVEEYNSRTDEYEKIDCAWCPPEMRRLEDAEALAAGLQDIAGQSLQYIDRHAVTIVERLARCLGHWLPLKPFKRRRKDGGD